MKSRHQLRPGQLTEIGFDGSSHVGRGCDGCLPIAILDDPVVTTMVESNANGFAPQEDFAPVVPGNRSVFDPYAPAFALDPALVFVDELLRFPTRTTARDRYPEGAIRPHAQDVAARAPHAHEFDRRSRRWWLRTPGRDLGRLWRRGLEKWEVELHSETS
jgi:hypothetical protein